LKLQRVFLRKLDIGTLKSNTTKKSFSVVNDFIEIPTKLTAAQQDIILCLDSIKVNGSNCLTTISQNVQYRTAQPVKRQTPEQYKATMTSASATYNLGAY
jgi:hypothetical protein